MQSFIKISLILVLFQGGYAKQAQTGHTAPVQDSYIVTLKSSTNDNEFDGHLKEVRNYIDSDQHSSGKNKIKHVYGEVLKGYSAEFTDDVLAKVKAMPEVDAVEKDQLGKFSSIQTNSSWGLARLSSDSRLPVDNQSFSYNYDPSAGEGVDVFVIDTGIKTDHPDFQGRALWGANFIDNSRTDDIGHGTHVAGIIGSDTYGVAKKATLVAVKMGNATLSAKASQVIDGVVWAVRNRRKGRGCVINLSLEVKYSVAFNIAVRNAVRLGCVVVVAAGNGNIDACNKSPASEPSAITVGASNLDDKRYEFSNWGQCLDVFAPGEDILSLSTEGDHLDKSGTSMAAAHVSGLAANVMSKTGNYNPADVLEEIIFYSKRGVLTNVGKRSPNLLVSNIGIV
ncbi:hypothetical protein DSO57_1016117 [Entomophthora muscae]|uniref:Uncharacterized protein n=1 Tax=Entomophthora muscae TaxID=34485 RepID=A0ACC2SHW0_9FUNG|nr:hypothetical protein DSO57_1016117 [Entomophthora muscae]